MASFTILVASSSVLPSVTNPGKEGTVTVYPLFPFFSKNAVKYFCIFVFMYSNILHLYYK
ncbi:MAG: hypothetical protein RL536_129 [Candidatus Parcubacteria bacterium]